MKNDKEVIETKSNGKTFYKKWWFWVIIVLVFSAITSPSSDETNSANNIISTNVNFEKVQVAVVDFSQMSKEDIQKWGISNKVNCNITEEYSDTITKGDFISQSKEANTTIYEGDKITIIYSLGKEPTMEQKNALKKAESYSSMMHMSKAKIYEQLTSEYGEGFTVEAAQYAIDNIVADWNANALAKAKSYQTTMNMSKQKIYQQLTSEYGEAFTTAEAQYAIDNLED